MRKISSPLGFDPRTVQPVASRYAEYATRPTDDGHRPQYYSSRFCVGRHVLDILCVLCRAIFRLLKIIGSELNHSLRGSFVTRRLFFRVISTDNSGMRTGCKMCTSRQMLFIDVEMSGKCSTNWIREKCVGCFDIDTRRKRTT